MSTTLAATLGQARALAKQLENTLVEAVRLHSDQVAPVRTLPAFKVGDLVRRVKPYNSDPPVASIGVVRCFYTQSHFDESVGVQWGNTFTKGHSLEGNLRVPFAYSGYYMRPGDLELA